MSHPENPSGPQFRGDRPIEQEAVHTTIVGGRPPGSGQPLGSIPRGIEVLLKKAAVDPAFRELLLADRVAAAEQIGLVLESAEAAMLAVAPREHLEAIIARTSVPQEQRRAFLGQAAAAMLAAMGVITSGCEEKHLPTKGVRPDRLLPKTAGIAPGPRPETPKNVDSKKPDDGPGSPVPAEHPKPQSK